MNWISKYAPWYYLYLLTIKHQGMRKNSLLRTEHCWTSELNIWAILNHTRVNCTEPAWANTYSTVDDITYKLLRVALQDYLTRWDSNSGLVQLVEHLITHLPLHYWSNIRTVSLINIYLRTRECHGFLWFWSRVYGYGTHECRYKFNII